MTRPSETEACVSIVTGSKQERQGVDRINARRYASNIRLAEVRAGWRTSTGACQIVYDVDEIGHSKTMEKEIKIGADGRTKVRG